MEIEMQRDALHPEYAMPVRRAGDVRKTGHGKQMYTGTGWVDCDGRTLLTVDYPMLFAALAYSFGGGGGQFKLPDLRENGSQVHPESALPSRPVQILLARATCDQAQADQAKLYRDLTSDAMAMGFDGIPAALDALRKAGKP